VRGSSVGRADRKRVPITSKPTTAVNEAISSVMA